ncbi:hypothetical protein V1477_014672 [Vespula maculifrons]|uniref:Uncharacterized protein n=1 Tax=Vespula maculifrons TaxID=7453 RepID=A0ABD2BI43_VESMC
MVCEQVAHNNLPALGKISSPVRKTDIEQSKKSFRKPSFILGTHDKQRGGTSYRANSWLDFTHLSHLRLDLCDTERTFILLCLLAVMLVVVKEFSDDMT